VATDGDDKIKKIARFYLFYGPNEYMLKKRVASLIKTVIPEGGEAFDLDRFDGKRCDLADLLNGVSTPPVMSPLRVVVLENVDKLPTKKQALLNDSLEKIPDYSVLAMTAEKADRRSKMFKNLLSKKKIAFKFGEFSPAESAGLAVKFALERGKNLDPELADVIIGLYGYDLYGLENEIEKLALLIGDREEIEKKDLAFSTGFSHVETAYDLPELAIGGKIKEALELCGRALSSGINEMQILYLFKGYLNRLNAACNLKEYKDLMRIYRIPPGAARQIFAQSRKVKPSAILNCLGFIFRAEYALKSARFPSKRVAEILVVAIYLACGGNK
jgi:DNA polymerase-3 subunit delta